jgi:hypothetical protein
MDAASILALRQFAEDFGLPIVILAVFFWALKSRWIVLGSELDRKASLYEKQLGAQSALYEKELEFRDRILEEERHHREEAEDHLAKALEVMADRSNLIRDLATSLTPRDPHGRDGEA